MGGLKFKVTDVFKFGFDLAYVNATAGMSQFRFTTAEQWAAPKPNQNYDMSRVHTYSDLDTTRFESDLWAMWGIADGLSLRSMYSFFVPNEDGPLGSDDISHYIEVQFRYTR